VRPGAGSSWAPPGVLGPAAEGVQPIWVALAVWWIQKEKEKIAAHFQTMFTDDACVRLLMEGARSSRASSGGGQLLDGVFRRMLDPTEFQRIVFPGLSAAERAAGPQSLQSLVSDARYADAVRALVPGATERARKVLDAVKVRGAVEGDFMDADTEAALWPNVFQEAFAREVVALMNRISTAAHASQARPSTRVLSLAPDTATTAFVSFSSPVVV
jgi:hypothetical protein